MSTPTVIQVSPNPNAVDVVLGIPVVVTFDQLMDTTTITNETFAVTCQGITKVISPEQLNVFNPQPASGRTFVRGTFSFATNGSSATVVTFTPNEPLRPNVIYTVILVGAAGSTIGAAIKSAASPEVPLDNNVQWSFTTGELDISTPPVTSPIPPLTVPLDPSKVRIEQQIWSVGNDLSQEITFVFPAPIDTATVSPEQILMSLEPILNDPSVVIPTGLTATATISGNTITVVVSGWPAS